MNTVNAVQAWLLAGTPPNWIMTAFVAFFVLSLVNDVLRKTKKVQANSVWELVFGQINKLLLPIFGRVPLFGPFLAFLDHPEANLAITPKPTDKPAVPPVPPAAAVLILIGFGLALSGCIPSADVKRYEAALSACLESEGIAVGESTGLSILQILETSGGDPQKIETGIENQLISAGGKVVEDVAICAVEAWAVKNPVTPNTSPTPSQVAVRVFQAKHAARYSKMHVMMQAH